MKQKKRQKKRTQGQALSLDIVIALIGFLFILLFLLLMWNQSTTKIEEYNEEQDVFMITYYASEVLLKTEGNPSNWHQLSVINRSEIYSIGLLDGEVISTDKLERLSDLNSTYYEEIKTILGVLGPNYNILIEVYFFDTNEYLLDSSLTFGKKEEGTESTSVQRIFKLDDNRIGRMHISVSW